MSDAWNRLLPGIWVVSMAIAGQVGTPRPGRPGVIAWIAPVLILTGR